MKKMTGMAMIVLSGLFGLSGCQVIPVLNGEGSVEIRDGNTQLRIAFSDRDRRHIHDYYHERSKHHKKKKKRGLPPGLAKRDQLPPGLAKRDRLPPGLGGERLPDDLDDKLSRLPSGYIRVRIGTDLVLMNEKTRVVFDIVKGLPLN